MKPVIIIAIAFVLLIPLSIFAQTGSRDIMDEYCETNWQRDPVQCANYVPDDFDQNKAYYSAQEAEKAKLEAEKINREVRESERICPDGSHVTADNQGNSICVDSSGRFVGYPNTGDMGLEGNTGMIVGGVVVVIIIVAVIAKTSRSNSSSDLETKPLGRRGWTDSQHKQVLNRQNGKCAICGEHSGTFQFDHKDDNNNNNDLDNCQALCPNCHDRKSRHLD